MVGARITIHCQAAAPEVRPIKNSVQYIKYSPGWTIPLKLEIKAMLPNSRLPSKWH